MDNGQNEGEARKPYRVRGYAKGEFCSLGVKITVQKNDNLYAKTPSVLDGVTEICI